MLAPRARGLGALSMCSETNSARSECGGRPRHAARATDSGRLRGSSRPAPGRARRACREAHRASWSVSCFSLTSPETLIAPGSLPPCPASITTIGRPGGLRSAIDAIGNRRRKRDREAGLPRLADGSARSSPGVRSRLTPDAIATPTTATADDRRAGNCNPAVVQAFPHVSARPQLCCQPITRTWLTGTYSRFDAALRPQRCCGGLHGVLTGSLSAWAEEFSRGQLQMVPAPRG